MVTIKVKEIRRQKGLTVRQLSAKSGISTSQISRVENNSQIPTIETLCELAYALEVPVTDTFSFVPESKPPP